VPSQLLRLFIAIPVPKDVADALDCTQIELRQSLPSPSIRWTSRSQFHLTLKFLGNLDSTQLPPLREDLRAVCAQFGPIELRAQTFGAFPNLQSPRIIWAGLLDRTGKLDPLQRAIEERLKPLLTQEREEQFHAHITLARVKSISSGDLAGLQRAVEARSNAGFGTWTAREVHLVQSQLSPAGSQYTVLTRASLLRQP
jgi:RNA 2',3'-cyclic 3'-phosphodiesterase